MTQLIAQTSKGSIEYRLEGAGPTALAFAIQQPARLRMMVLESAMTLPWEKSIQRGSLIAFGRTERITWAFTRGVLALAPGLIIQALLRGLTTLNVRQVYRRMSTSELDFVKQMIRTSRSGSGFLNDIQHKVEGLALITCPVLVMYCPYDKTVSPANAHHAGSEIPGCELFVTSADTHLIWIGKSAQEVWDKRLAFLRA